MSDSLRDQLLKAGFAEKKTKSKPKPKKPVARKQPNKPANTSAEEAPDKAQLERKRIKAEIKTLIESTAVKDFKGDKVYSYILGSRVKQLYVTEDCHRGISVRELAITRLNGNTYLIPLTTAESVKKLNPDWAIVVAPDDSDAAVDDEYADYKIPDDLDW
ncbi:MAG: DUF2058 family protein [Gammaproteobacteria bacterium]|nr:DUF2058 family protein [Gammaproteobacteria bacterium]